ncbi:hypothetical protein AB0912_05875 [Streptomyces sp. NPDC007084]|uniref:hypothetical protein n=1 Tax=Streptomyces sp. NPDC007084 TaxID=3154313 RepID=UPI0034542FFF
MTAHTATKIARHLGRLLCGHLALAMASTAAVTVLGAHSHRPALYALWAALPLTGAAWAVARATEKRRMLHERNASTADPTDWTSAA